MINEKYSDDLKKALLEDELKEDEKFLEEMLFPETMEQNYID